MSEIKRYEPVEYTTEQHKYGRFVRYTDHLAALQQAKIDAVRFAVDKAADAFGCKNCSFTSREMLAREIIEQLKEQGDE